MKKISIVVSVYNEEQVLKEYIKEFEKIKDKLLCDYELIFVNDGSSDNSLKILYELAYTDKNIKVISFSRNFGHEAAMLAGIDMAKGDGIVCMDSDLQHPLICILAIIEKFNHGFDIINMVRVSNKSAGLVKNITSKLFYKVVNILSSDTKFEENASDFFAINKKVAQILRKNYREKTRFLRGYVQSMGFNKTIIKYEAAERGGGASHYSLKKLVSFSISTIVCFSDFPLKLGIYAGIVVALLGGIVLIYTLLTYHNAPAEYTTIVVLICFLFALMFVILGVIGQYIAILFREVKDRPIYIIDEMVNFDMDK